MRTEVPKVFPGRHGLLAELRDIICRIMLGIHEVADAMTSRAFFADESGRWIDHVAATPAGILAWSAGWRIYLRGNGGGDRSIDVPSSVGGLAFSPESAEERSSL